MKEYKMKLIIGLGMMLSLVSGVAGAESKDGFIVIFKDADNMKTPDTENPVQTLRSGFTNTFSTINARINGFAVSFNSLFRKTVKIDTALWAINGVAGEFTRNELFDLIATGMVDGIYRDRIQRLDDINAQEAMMLNADATTYGLELTGVNKLKSLRPELNGSGVVVGIIDTGVDATHPDLKGKVIGFKDFIANKSVAYDDQGHGTHTAGTVAGGNASGTQIGVAPGAKIIAAKAFDGAGTSKDSYLLGAMQFMLDPDGDPLTADGPALVSNSWGGKQKTEDLANNAYQKIITQWIKAGIVPVFSAGNSGRKGSSTVGSPGSLPAVIAVAAVNQSKTVTDFSSRGPSYWKTTDSNGAITRKVFIKPDVAAPGQAVYSSFPNGQYKQANGTSMACPHVAGIVALLKQAKPNATSAEIRSVLESSSEDLGAAGKDNSYGFGLVNAYAAVNKLLQEH